MTSHAGSLNRTRTWTLAAAWLSVPLVVILYVWLRYLVRTSASVALSQLVFLAPLLLASLFAWAAVHAAPRGVRARWVWRFLALALTLILVGEVYIAWETVGGTPSGSGIDSFFDGVNALATVAFLAMLASTASVERLGWSRSARLLLDGTTLMTLGFSLLYGYWVHHTMAGHVRISSVDAARLAIYGMVGFLVLIGTMLVLVAGRSTRRQPWDRIVIAALVVYALGLILWPLWELAATGLGSSVLAAASVSTLYLVAYMLLFIAALQRVMTPSAPWLHAVAYPVDTGRVWPGILMSSLVFFAALFLGGATFHVPEYSSERLVYLAALSVCTVCIVGRTAIAAAEASALKDAAVTDPVTSAYGSVLLDERLSEMLESTEESGVQFAVVALDLDHFAKVVDSVGRRGGDEVLRSVTAALATAAGSRHSVFRLSGDEYVVLVPCDGRDQAERAIRRLQSAVSSVDAGDIELSVSAGYALCPTDAFTSDDLLTRAQVALAWAKHHGSGMLVAYDERTSRSRELDDRLGQFERSAKFDVARALAAAADARDPANYAHSRNVAALSRLLAEELGMEPEHVARVEIAAMLHDVGKIALPNVMLGGRTLSVRERATEQEHSALGQRLLESLSVEGVPLWVRAHHERWDGQGYPDGLSGDAIPVESRIIALSDAYDGMTMGKRYGAPMSKAAALQEIDLGMGARFDPDLSETFIAVVASVDSLGWSDQWPVP